MLFYEIIAIVMGVLIGVGGIIHLTKKSFDLKAGLTLLIIGLLYIILGGLGFIVPEKFEWIYTGALIILSVIAMVAVKLASKRQ